MLSLQNTYNDMDVENFDKRVEKILEGKPYKYYAELKYDGVSIAIRYENCLLKQAITRGNGVEGDDVTENIKTIKTLPKEIQPIAINGIILTDFEIRGEIFITDEDFIKLNEQQLLNNDKIYANSRNLTSGSIKLLDVTEVSKRPLQIVCYYLFSSQIRLTSQSENIEILKKMGFPTSSYSEVCSDISYVNSYIEQWRTDRHSLPMQTDGIVVKVNEILYHDFLGSVGRYPR
jgi:DNA ligase (NAD+)